jgi:hypothetical protein
MVERRELITICRQIGGMMDAGVDILRITRVLRAQTTNPRLLELYDQLDHDLRMGESIADAMEHAPDVFSPFAVSLVRQGETRNNLSAAFLKLAEYEQVDEDATADERLAEPVQTSRGAGFGRDRRGGPSTVSPLTVIVLNDLVDRLQLVALRALTIAAGLLLSLAGVWLLVEMGMLEERWRMVTLFSVAALFIGGSGSWVRRCIARDRAHSRRCSFCGGADEDGSTLQMAAHQAGAAICGQCISNLSHGARVAQARSPEAAADMDEEDDAAYAGQALHQRDMGRNGSGEMSGDDRSAPSRPRRNGWSRPGSPAPPATVSEADYD